MAGPWRPATRRGGRYFGSMAGPKVLDAPLVAGCVAATHNLLPAAADGL